MKQRLLRFFKMTGLALLSLAVVVVGLIALWPKPPQPPAHITHVAELETYLQQLTAFGAPPGLSLAVVKDGQIVYSQGFGLADGPGQIPAAPGTVYHWWSATKIPTAIAILQLQEQGLLKLDDPVASYLPFFKVQYPSAHSQVITLRHLLNHSSGLSDLNPAELFRNIHPDGAPGVNQTAFVEGIFPGYSKLAFEPGAQATYTNLGYMVLGAVIEKVSGQAYEDYIGEHILGPLTMTHTGYVYTDEMRATAAAGAHPIVNPITPLIPFMVPDWRTYVRDAAQGHLWWKRLYTNYTPPTGLIGPAPDAARLLLAYLNDGELDGQRILAPGTAALMTGDPVIGKGSGPAMFHKGLRHGLGWWVLDCGGRRCLEHTGEGPGFGAALRLYPDEKLGIVVLTNDMTSDRDAIMDLVADLDWGQ
jgi:CubicO group peptidase (beta-lactamase class C family)